eukprot:6877013-Prymnesium_polylepis.2
MAIVSRRTVGYSKHIVAGNSVPRSSESERISTTACSEFSPSSISGVFGSSCDASGTRSVAVRRSDMI